MSGKQSKRRIKAQLVQTRDTIVKKFRKLYNDRANLGRQLAIKYAPITDSINKLIDTKEKVITEKKHLRPVEKAGSISSDRVSLYRPF